MGAIVGGGVGVLLGVVVTGSVETMEDRGELLGQTSFWGYAALFLIVCLTVAALGALVGLTADGVRYLWRRSRR
jgi:hypothetical protein